MSRTESVLLGCREKERERENLNYREFEFDIIHLVLFRTKRKETRVTCTFEIKHSTHINLSCREEKRKSIRSLNLHNQDSKLQPVTLKK